MRVRLVLLLAILPVAGLAQRGGGGTGFAPGGFRPGRPAPMPGQGQRGFGRNPLWGRRGYRPFAPATFYYNPWLDPLGCASPFFPVIPSYGFCNGGSYPPPQPDASPPTNVIMLPPQPYLPMPGPFPIGDEPGPDDLSNAPQASAAITHQKDEAAVPVVVSKPPLASPLVEDEYPPVLVFKTGGMYSVRKYWIKNKTLYFVTTQGETLYAPLALLERVNPGKTAKR
ncbi:MAG TPA: hypothetical protein VLW65_17175 [Bryobacteraceae bacterium]|nr:hypothetical protein [Bryobacteraceae bacterium]